MEALRHRENGPSWRPRHPVVCLLNVIGFMTMIGLLAAYRPSVTTAVLPIAVALQYTVSGVYHWMPHNHIRLKLDLSVIIIVIAAYYVPYWGGLLSPNEAFVRFSFAVVGIVVLWGLLLIGTPRRINAVLWATFALTGFAISFGEFKIWLPERAFVLFWFAALCFGPQQVVFVLRRPNPYPTLFGYREIQHTFLLTAVTIGSMVALQNT